MNWKRSLKILATGIFLSLPWIGAQAQQVNIYCQASAGPPQQWVPCSATTPLQISGSFSATTTGFPGTTQTTGTPISVTSSAGGVTGSLPAGAVVVASNVGATNNAFCKLGASATVNDQLIAPNSWFGFTVGSNTQLTCITSASTTTINMVGGAGLPTGAGGGGGGGGSSSITSWGGGTLGAMANYGTSPGAVLVPGMNAFITNTPAVTLASTTINGFTSWAGGTLGAMTNYGTSPGTVLVPGVNAFVTNATPGIANNADGIAVVAASSTSPVPVNSYNYAFNGTTWDRFPIVAKSAAPTTAGNQAIVVDLRPDSPGIITLGPAPAATSVPLTVGPALLGSYCMGANTGTMAAGLGAAAPIYSFRYGGANLAIIRKVIAEADNITTAFVAGAAKFDMLAARSFSASDTGGTAATLTGNNGKLRTSFATTAISDLRISSTATLTAGTRTLDAQPLASVEFAVPTSIDADLLPTTTLFQSAIGESPFVLANNEGFVIQATVPGTGTWVASVRTCWDEVSAF